MGYQCWKCKCLGHEPSGLNSRWEGFLGVPKALSLLVLVEKLARCGSLSLSSFLPLWDFISAPQVSHFIHLWNKLRQVCFPPWHRSPLDHYGLNLCHHSLAQTQVPWKELIWSILVPVELGSLEGAAVMMQGGDLLPGNIKCSQTLSLLTWQSQSNQDHKTLISPLEFHPDV